MALNLKLKSFAVDPGELLNALPYPILTISPEGRVADANAASEGFFEMSRAMLVRRSLEDILPFGSPLLSLVDYVRTRGATVNEYRVDLGTP
jgi:two-component system nitrogen regulation sensor histidine kinase GlnL